MAGRKPSNAVTVVDVGVDEVALNEVAREADASANANAAFRGAFARANQLQGRMQMAAMITEISGAAQISAYAEIQEFKLFKHLDVSVDGILRPAQNFQEYCDLTFKGGGYSGVIEQMRFLRELGYTVYESLKSIDIDRKHFRALLKIEDKAEQTALVQQIIEAEGDPERIAEITESLTAKKDTAIAELTTARDLAQKGYDAELERSKELKKALNAMPEVLPWDEGVKPFMDDVLRLVGSMMQHNGELRARLETLGEYMAMNKPTKSQAQMVGVSVLDVVMALHTLVGETQLDALQEHAKAAGDTYLNLLVTPNA